MRFTTTTAGIFEIDGGPRGGHRFIRSADDHDAVDRYGCHVPSWFAPRLRRWIEHHPAETDACFAATVGVLTLIGLLTTDVEGSEAAVDWLAVGLVLAQAGALALRRRAPLRSAVAVVVFAVVYWIADYPMSNFDVLTVLAMYAATAHGGSDRGRVWRVVGALVALMTVIATIGVISPEEDLPPAAVFGIAALHITAAVTGEIVYGRRLRLAEYEQRALRAEAERELLARQAVRDERARIARDLHDVVAHGMSVMVVQAGAAERMIDRDPDAAADALGHIQRAGREALTQMRQMLELLRDDQPAEAALAPQPSIHDLERLARDCTDSGIPTELIVDGASDGGSVGQEMAAYRIVQEALTNVLKHAGHPTSAVVRVRYGDDAIRLEVLDDGVGATETSLQSATGHGLIGMRERIDLYGGTLRVGPRPGGGFRVAATIPTEPADHPSTTPAVSS